MKLVDFRHVAKQHFLLAQQVAGDEVSHGRVVHLRCVALDIFFLLSHYVFAFSQSLTSQSSLL